ncbi:hotdog domain-containing protein [Nocardioides sp. BYT-33-1]|uniref:hotdog domain-containing protein n=1 Tax=Nocardioides sp. BYT-33-1 TaxID=3416952 RepID=UPI003F5332EA
MSTVTHRRYVSHGDAHYAGGLADGAFVLRLFGEVATEISIATDGDEGLLAGYESVGFLAPVYAGDIVEVTGRAVEFGRRSRRLELTCHVTARADASTRESGSVLLDEKILVTEAIGILVVPGEQG